MDRGEFSRVATHFGMPADRFNRLWAEFQEFKALVEKSAAELGIPQPSPQFSRFGLAMLAAKDHGAYEALESLVT